MSDDDAPETPQAFGRFRLIQRIGRGGMAEVFRAYVEGSETFQSTFVIKRIRPEKSDSAELVDLFVNEARICALLRHPNIVEVYDFGQIGGAYFMSMEYLRGRDLAAVLRALRAQRAAVPPLVAARIAREVALGLAHAHAARLPDGRAAEIVHRDVTPSNVMLLPSGAVKVLDFGIAKAAASAAPRAEAPGGERKSRVRGKLAYLSPEQVRNGELDGRSDVFSLGVVLWEMLVGQRLFAAENEFQTLRNVLTMPLPAPASRRADVPAALDAVVVRALARDREQRFSTAGALADALAVALPDAARPAGAAALGHLLGTLFGDGDLGISVGRFTSTFTGVTDSSPEVPAAPPPATVVVTASRAVAEAPQPPRRARRLPKAVLVGLAAVAASIVALVAFLWRGR